MTRTPIGLLLSGAVLIGCTSIPSPAPGAISCQPVGYTPAPIPFSFAPGPVTSSAAEQTAVALFRACAGLTSTITGLMSSSEAATGTPGGPNAGQPVWHVRVDATVTLASPGGDYESHYFIEVNQATGAPTVLGYG